MRGALKGFCRDAGWLYHRLCTVKPCRFCVTQPRGRTRKVFLRLMYVFGSLHRVAPKSSIFAFGTFDAFRSQGNASRTVLMVSRLVGAKAKLPFPMALSLQGRRPSMRGQSCLWGKAADGSAVCSTSWISQFLPSSCRESHLGVSENRGS